jgi:DNA-binding LacI/PurR family transcriptional regulator
MARFRKATIKEVALRAGVSTTTVSYFVNGRENVCSPETGQRIREAVEEFNYTANSLVTGMQTNNRHAVGACLSSPWDPDITTGGFFFERIWQGICEQADSDNYSVLRFPASARNTDRCNAFLDGRVDGILYHARGKDNAKPARIASAGMPIVLMTRSTNIPDGCGAVYTNERYVVELALNRLWDLGHRQIAHLAGPVDQKAENPTKETEDVAVDRKIAYENWMAERNVADPHLVAAALWWYNSDVTGIVRRWRSLSIPPTAILCANDELAVSAIQAAMDIGWSVPNEVSIVGIDNSGAVGPIRFGLTTVDPKIRGIGRESLAGLLKIINGTSPEDVRISVTGAEWIERGTVSRPLSRALPRLT